MKILAIRLKNLTSIEGSVEIDFTSEPLRSAGIFAISGPTGAGKSTLLDALCLALYDKAPRFAGTVENIDLADVGENTIGQSDVKNFLRRGMGEGYAEVDFLGMTGCRYRSRWSVRRTRNKADGSLKSQTMEVTNLDTGSELQGNKKELLARLTELVGLTYEQFTRTVLLAQNDFATFLKSRGSAKAELLEKLTGTEVYSRISQEVFVRNKAALEEVNLLKSNISFIELLPEEEYQTLLQEKGKLAELRTSGIKRLAEQNAQLNVIRSLKTQEEVWQKKCRDEVAEAEKGKALQESLVLQTEGLTRFKAQWEAIQPDLRKARQVDVQIQSMQNRYEQVSHILQTARKQTIEQDKKCQSAMKNLQSASQSLDKLLKQDGQELPSHRPEQIEHLLGQEEQALTVQQQANDERLSHLNAFKYPALMEEQSKWQKELLRLQNVRQLVTDSTKAEKEIDRLRKETDSLAQQFTAKEAQLKTLQRLYDNARIAMGKDVQELRRNLRGGEPCPVCGGMEHPYHQEDRVVDTLYRSIEQEYNTVAEEYRLLNNRTIAANRDIRNLTGILEQYRSQLAALRKDAGQEDGPEKIQNRLNELAAQIRSYHQLNEEWRLQDEVIKKLRTHCEALRESIAQFRLLTQKVASAKEQFVLLQTAETAELKRFEEVDKELVQLRQERAGLLKGKPADEAEALVLKKEKELNTALERARKEVEVSQAHLSGLQGELKQLRISIQELAKQKEQIEAPDALPQTIEQQQETNLNTERQLSSVEARLLQQEKNKVLQAKIAKELEAKQTVSEQWGKLNKLIGSADGAKFKVIAQSYTLNLLLLHANKHLSYLSKRYKLQQVPDTLALQVIDCDMCDEVRTVYSLSGGESFLISLALALGLSSLSSNNLKVESLFIDEGFGSLDADSLRTAMEALEQLQMQGRKIGVISHVQEMSERISVQVEVHKSVNGRSRIRIRQS